MHTLDLQQQHTFAHQQRVGLSLCLLASLSAHATERLPDYTAVRACMHAACVCKSDAERRERPAATYSEKGAQRLGTHPAKFREEVFLRGLAGPELETTRPICMCVCVCVCVRPTMYLGYFGDNPSD